MRIRRQLTVIAFTLRSPQLQLSRWRPCLARRSGRPGTTVRRFGCVRRPPACRISRTSRRVGVCRRPRANRRSTASTVDRTDGTSTDALSRPGRHPHRRRNPPARPSVRVARRPRNRFRLSSCLRPAIATATTGGPAGSAPHHRTRPLTVRSASDERLRDRRNGHDRLSPCAPLRFTSALATTGSSTLRLAREGEVQSLDGSPASSQHVHLADCSTRC
jgi:hypothetical protein